MYGQFTDAVERFLNSNIKESLVSEILLSAC